MSYTTANKSSSSPDRSSPDRFSTRRAGYGAAVCDDDDIVTAAPVQNVDILYSVPLAMSVGGGAAGGGAGGGAGGSGGSAQRGLLERMLATTEEELRQELLANGQRNTDKIKKLTDLVLRLDDDIKNLRLSIESDAKDAPDSDYDSKVNDEDSKCCAEDDKKEQLIDFSLKKNIANFVQSRWKWNKDDGSTAKGCIRLNPLSLSRAINKIIELVLVLDISYSMDDAPLEDLGVELQDLSRYFVETDLKVKLTCIRYGAFHDKFIDKVDLNMKTIRNVCEEIKNKIGTPAVKYGADKGRCLMGGRGGIRTDTRFEAPLRCALESVKDCVEGGNSVGVIAWYSDGKERSTDTDVIALAEEVFLDGVGNLNVDMCSCGFGKDAGENTKMQKLASWWDEHCNSGTGYFCSANTISGLALFTKESAMSRFFTPIATHISVTLPNGELVNYEKIVENPIDIPIEAPIGMGLRLGTTEVFSLERINPEITIEFCQPGIGEEDKIFTIKIPTIDPVQIKHGGRLVSSGQTEIAHIIKKINDLQKTVTGLKSKASKEVDINRECLRLMKQIGVWNDSGEWVPEVFDFGSSRKTAAKHQIPKKDRYIEIQAAIDSAQKIIDGRDTLEDSFQMQAAVRGFSQAYQSATKGDSIRSAYCRYGCVIDDSDSD